MLFGCGFLCGAFVGFYWVQWIRSLYERQYDAFTYIHEEPPAHNVFAANTTIGANGMPHWPKDGGP